MNIDNLKTFCVLAHHKSFRVTSEILQVSQSGVSRRIQSIEDELGTSLLLRTSKSVDLTKQGKIFLQYAKRTVDIFEEGMNKILNEAEEEKLVIASSPATLFNLLPGVLKQFSLQYRTRLTIITAISQQVYDMLVDQTIDVGFTTVSFPNPHLKFKKIYSEKVVCVGHPDLINEYMRQNEIYKKPIPMICNMIRNNLWTTINDNLFNNPLVEVTFESNSFKASEILAKLGVGFTLLPLSDAKEGLSSGQLDMVTLPIIDIPERSIYVVTYKNNPKKHTVKQFTTIVTRMLTSAATN